MPTISFFLWSVLLLVLFWVATALFFSFKQGKIRLSRFPFSPRLYYAAMAVFLIYPLWQALRKDSFELLMWFAVFAVAGIVGETVFSAWWHAFYRDKFWVYKIETLANKYTSFLNFVPWAVGGLLYLTVVQEYAKVLAESIRPFAAAQMVPVPFFVIFALSFLAGIVLQLTIFAFLHIYKSQNYKFKTVRLGNFLFFTLPFLLALSSCTILYGKHFVVLAGYFALAGTAAEYLFGKVIELLLSKQLWQYNHLAVDNGHLTPLSPVFFSLAGFYFWGIAVMLRAIFS